MIAVADGVGGWADSGIDVSLFSRELCFHLKRQYEIARRTKQIFEINLRNILTEAVFMTQHVGTSTMVMASLDKDTPHLYGLNYGDSGYILVRPSKDGKKLDKFFRTTEQQHYFDCPYQCGSYSRPEFALKAETYLHRVETNDLIVMGSDGLLDNLFDEDILACIEPRPFG